MATRGNITCPRCGGTAFEEQDAGPDGYEDDITYTAYICVQCKLYYSGWTEKWYLDCESWTQEETAEEFTASPKT